jgi:hypothetical protein
MRPSLETRIAKVEQRCAPLSLATELWYCTREAEVMGGLNCGYTGE